MANGELVKPELPVEATAAQRKELSDWLKIDNAAQKVIATSVVDSQLVHIMNCTSEMWRALHNLYEQKSETSVHMLQQRWYKMSKESNESMASYIAKLKNLAYRLQALGEPIADPMLITKILMTLPEVYNHFITAWESTPQAQRTLENLIERLLAEESRHSTKKKGVSEAFAAMKLGKKKKNEKGKRNNNSSRETDATEDSSIPDDTCYKCGKPGHWARGCRSRKGQSQTSDKKLKGQALVTQTSVCLNHTVDNSEIWYMDSGATDHMSNQESWFVNLKYFEKPYLVNVGKKESRCKL